MCHLAAWPVPLSFAVLGFALGPLPGGAPVGYSANTCRCGSQILRLLSCIAFLLKALIKIRGKDRTLQLHLVCSEVSPAALNVQHVGFRESVAFFCRNTEAGAGQANFLTEAREHASYGALAASVPAVFFFVVCFY